jgi:hypothetical protein
MRDMTIMGGFLKQGGTEMAPMSTSRDKAVALNFAASVTPLVFYFKVRSQRLCSIVRPKVARWAKPQGFFEVHKNRP